MITNRVYNYLSIKLSNLHTKAYRLETSLRLNIRKLRYFYKPIYSQVELQAFADNVCARLNIAPVEVVCNMGRGSYYKHDVAVFIDQLAAFEYNDMPVEMVIAHEVKHHFQHITGRLQADGWFTKLWDGVPVKDNWYDSPWEIDAVEYENAVALELGLPVKRVIINGGAYELNGKPFRKGDL